MSNSGTPWTAACQVTLFLTVSWSLLKFMFTEIVMLSNHLIFCHTLLLLSSIFPSIKVFPVSFSHQVVKVLELQLFNMLSSFLIAFLPRSKNLLILWLQSPCTVILEANKIKSTLIFPIYLP